MNSAMKFTCNYTQIQRLNQLCLREWMVELLFGSCVFLLCVLLYFVMPCRFHFPAFFPILVYMVLPNAFSVLSYLHCFLDLDIGI
ncbi:unnamed protein product [Lathyrus oleraceus]